MFGGTINSHAIVRASISHPLHVAFSPAAGHSASCFGKEPAFNGNFSLHDTALSVTSRRRRHFSARSLQRDFRACLSPLMIADGQDLKRSSIMIAQITPVSQNDNDIQHLSLNLLRQHRLLKPNSKSFMWRHH